MGGGVRRGLGSAGSPLSPGRSSLGPRILRAPKWNTAAVDPVRCSVLLGQTGTERSDTPRVRYLGHRGAGRQAQVRATSQG